MEMESRLGEDFSGVRIHTDARASQTAVALGAQAYTVGRDIVFAADWPGHGIDRGRRVLAHELAHVQQQSRGAVSGTALVQGIAVSDALDPFERDAELIASRAMAIVPQGKSGALGNREGNGPKHSGARRSERGHSPLHACAYPRHSVGQLVRGRGSPIVVQRFDTGEHAQMGSDEPIMVNGVMFTRKQLIAMGDFFESYDQMSHADPAELRRLKSDIEAQTKFYRHEPGGRDVPEGKGGWDDDTGGRYLKLAKANATHFAPGRLTEGHDHKTVWEDNHIRALAVTRAAVDIAGNGSVAVPQEAYAINSFGNHFLTDAFAVGHLIAKADVMDEAKRSFGSLEHTEAWWQVYFYRNDFTDRVASFVMSDPKAKAFDAYRLKLIAWRDIDAHRLSELLFQFAGRESELFYSNIVKSIHDELNHAILHHPAGSPDALMVENDRGDTWLATGDTTLNADPRTLSIINQAIAKSEANLEQAAAAPRSRAGPLGVDDFMITRVPPMLKAVWSYTPHPTKATQRKIESVIRESTDTSRVIAARRFADVILDHLPEVISGLKDKGVLATKAELHKEAQEMMRPEF